MIDKIVLASGNAGKLREFSQIFSEWQVEVLPQFAFDVPEAEETGLSFIENAILKARNAARHSGLPALADDSGLAVDALGGAPGIYSARFAGAGADDAKNNSRLLEALQGVDDSHRGAAFYCALAFVRSAEDPVPVVCTGSWRGRILQAPRGEQGFGYDPLFWVEEHRCSSAELARETKNRISHRARAMEHFAAAWQALAEEH